MPTVEGVMPDSRWGTGAHGNFDEELVGLLMSKLTPLEVELLHRASTAVLVDSIAEAWQRKERQFSTPVLLAGTVSEGEED